MSSANGSPLLQTIRLAVRISVLCAVTLSTMSAHAQDPAKAAPIAPPGRAPENIRAFTGDWTNDNIIVGLTKPGVVPLRADYDKKLQELAKLAVAGDEVPGNEPKCIPNGPAMDMAFGMRIFADARELVVLTSGPRVRDLWVDGRQHTPDDLLFESFSGESVAHWEGNTLVVDTIGLKASDEIIWGIAVNDDKMHIIERWHLLSPSKLQIQTTIEDAVALTRPWTYTRTYSRVPSIDLNYCTPAVDRARDGQFDLTPPTGGYIPPDAKH